MDYEKVRVGNMFVEGGPYKGRTEEGMGTWTLLK